MTPQYRPRIPLPSLPPGTAKGLISFAEQCGIELLPWQKHLIESLEEGPPTPAPLPTPVVPVSTELARAEAEDPVNVAFRAHLDAEVCKMMAPEPVPVSATEWWAECFPQWKGSQ